MSRTCSVLYAAMVRNLDEKDKAKIDRQLEDAVMLAESGGIGHRNRRRRRAAPVPAAPPPAADAPSKDVVSQRFGRKTPPPGFGSGTMDQSQIGDVQKFTGR